MLWGLDLVLQPLVLSRRARLEGDWWKSVRLGLPFGQMAKSPTIRPQTHIVAPPRCSSRDPASNRSNHDCCSDVGRCRSRCFCRVGRPQKALWRLPLRRQRRGRGALDRLLGAGGGGQQPRPKAGSPEHAAWVNVRGNLRADTIPPARRYRLRLPYDRRGAHPVAIAHWQNTWRRRCGWETAWSRRVPRAARGGPTLLPCVSSFPTARLPMTMQQSPSTSAARSENLPNGPSVGLSTSRQSTDSRRSPRRASKRPEAPF